MALVQAALSSAIAVPTEVLADFSRRVPGTCSTEGESQRRESCREERGDTVSLGCSGTVYWRIAEIDGNHLTVIIKPPMYLSQVLFIIQSN